MLDTILSFVAPHLCSGCGEIGTPLCDNCKYNITQDPFLSCLSCGKPTGAGGNLCLSCRPGYNKAWCVGERSGVLQRLVGNYKFQNMHAVHRSLSSLLDESLPNLPPETIIVPIPTSASHIRERGYDHMLLVVRHFARLRQLEVQQVVGRRGATVQHHANRQKRLAQVKQTFFVNHPIDVTVPYLIIDDVVTTGATVGYVSKLLRQAGAKQVWVAAIARQPID
jgi:competence protein ComFC